MKCRTLSLNAYVKEMTTELLDCVLLAKLSEADMFATNSLYHSSCLTALYNKFKKFKRSSKKEVDMLREIEEEALADVVEYVKDTISLCYESNKVPVFTQKFSNRIIQRETSIPRCFK